MKFFLYVNHNLASKSSRNGCGHPPSSGFMAGTPRAVLGGKLCGVGVVPRFSASNGDFLAWEHVVPAVVAVLDTLYSIPRHHIDDFDDASYCNWGSQNMRTILSMVG